MAGLYEQFKTNESLETDGIWLEYGETSEGKPIRIKCARAGGNNIRFKKALERATRPHRRAIQNDTLDDKVADKIFREVYADTIVLDWENVQDREGKVMKFTRENVIKLFEDLPDLFADLREQCGKMALFREEVLEGALGNSGGSLSTDSIKAQ